MPKRFHWSANEPLASEQVAVKVFVRSKSIPGTVCAAHVSFAFLLAGRAEIVGPGKARAKG